MQRQHFSQLLVAILVAVLALSGLASAQEDNLLTNPGFENGFNGQGVANGWQSWVSDAADAPGFQVAPQYLAGSTVEDNGLLSQIRSGSDAQALFSFFETHDAGIYQQVDVSNGAEYRFSIYAHVYSSSLSDLSLSEQPGGVTVRVGIDPTGGTDPLADSVEYEEALITYDTYLQYSTIAIAESDTITVFVRSTVTEPVQNTVVFLDDAVVNITPESPDPVETEESEEPTEEPVETEEPTPTREGDPVETEEPEETEEPTEEPVETEEPETEEPTEEPVETEEPETEEPTEEPVETEEPEEETPLSEDFPGTILHTVQRGDAVGRLAARYGSSTQAIIEANGLNDSALIFVGQGLIIPVRIVPATETPSATPVVVVVTATPGESGGTNGGGAVSGNTYVVQPGDNLNAIAQRFNTTVGALVQLNGIANPNRILVGQELSIPGTGGSSEPVATSPAPETETEEVEEQDNSGIIPPADGSSGDSGTTTYVVQPGDNLFRIALRNGVSLGELADANNITNFNLIFVGQVLTLP